MVKTMSNNGWTNDLYHDEKGKILGAVSEYHAQHKALLNGVFIGFYISKEHAMKSVEEAYKDQLTTNI